MKIFITLLFLLLSFISLSKDYEAGTGSGHRFLVNGDIVNSSFEVTVDGNTVVGDAVTGPASAIFYVASGTKGSVPCPAMGQATVDALTPTAQIGYCVYNTDEKSIQTFDGSIWSSAAGALVVGTPLVPVIVPSTGLTYAGSSNTIVYVQSTGGHVDVTAVAQIVNTNGQKLGDTLTIVQVSAVDTIGFVDGNGLALNGPILLKEKYMLNLIHDGTNWQENNRTANSGQHTDVWADTLTMSESVAFPDLPDAGFNKLFFDADDLKILEESGLLSTVSTLELVICLPDEVLTSFDGDTVVCVPGSLGGGSTEHIVGDWSAGLDVKENEVRQDPVTGALYRSASDHTTAVDVATELINGDSVLTSGPPLATGSIAGTGIVTITSPTEIQVTAGQGVRTDYTTTLQPSYEFYQWPLTTNLVLADPLGWSTVYINGTTGVLETAAGLPTLEFFYDNVVLARVNPTVGSGGSVVSMATMPSDPVSLLRDLSLFLGLLTRDLNFDGLATQQIKHFDFSIYSWGIDSGNGPKAASTEIILEQDPLQFDVYNQNGIDLNDVNIVDVDNYDLGGVTTAIGNNDAAYVRVYMSPDGQVALLRSQSDYNTFALAKQAIGDEQFSLIVPPTLEEPAFRWVASLVFVEGTVDLSSANPLNAEMITCGGYGCGAAGGASGGGSGNMIGPISPATIVDQLVLWNSIDGTITKASSYLMTPIATATEDNKIFQYDHATETMVFTDYGFVANDDLAIVDLTAITLTSAEFQSIQVQGDGGPVTLDATAPFGAGPFKDRTVVTLIGTDDTNTVTLLFSDTANGPLINGDIILEKDVSITLQWIEVDSRWKELGRNE